MECPCPSTFSCLSRKNIEKENLATRRVGIFRPLTKTNKGEMSVHVSQFRFGVDVWIILHICSSGGGESNCSVKSLFWRSSIKVTQFRYTGGNVFIFLSFDPLNSPCAFWELSVGVWSVAVTFSVLKKRREGDGEREWAKRQIWNLMQIHFHEEGSASELTNLHHAPHHSSDFSDWETILSWKLWNKKDYLKRLNLDLNC